MTLQLIEIAPDMASTEAETVLRGHGKPRTEGVKGAVERARNT